MKGNLYVPKQGHTGQVTIVEGTRQNPKTRLVTLNLLSDSEILDLRSDGHLIGVFEGVNDEATKKFKKKVAEMTARKGNRMSRKGSKKYNKLNVTIPALKVASAPVATPAVNPVFALAQKYDLTPTTAAKILKGKDAFANDTKTTVRDVAKSVGVPNPNSMEKQEALDQLFAIVEA